jgi:hypothetical protein
MLPLLSLNPGVQRQPPPLPLSLPRYNKEFPTLLLPGAATPKLLHSVIYLIDTDSAALARPQRLDLEKHFIAEEEFLALEKAGIISSLNLRPGHPCSTWSPTCSHSITTWQAALACQIDLVKGYHQIPIAETDIPKMAIVSSFGLFEFLFMDFGLTNSAQALQRLKDNIFLGLDYVFFLF